MFANTPSHLCVPQDPNLLSHPLVSPTYLKDLSGLCQHAMLLVAGGAELMRPDIAAFAAKAAAAGGGQKGVSVVYHEEPLEPHVFAVLMLPHLLKKGLVVPRFVAAVVKGEEGEGLSSRGEPPATAAAAPGGF